MNYYQRLIAILFEPDYATFDLHQAPHLGEAFLVVSAYAVVSAINYSVSGFIATGSITAALMALVAQGLTALLLWILASILFHLIAIPLGGHGQFPHAFGYVGLALAPQILVSLVSFLLMLLTATGLLAEYLVTIEYLRLAIEIIGMAWGMPGVICYFGMKNAERLESYKVMIVTLILFVAFAGFALYNSYLFS